MITKETYKNLVLAASSILKTIIKGQKMIEKYNHSDKNIPIEVYEFLESEDNYKEFLLLVLAVNDMDFGVKHPPEFLRFTYSDTVSMFVFDNENADRYLELVYELLTTNSVPEELRKIEEETSMDIRCWVRRNLLPSNPLQFLKDM